MLTLLIGRAGTGKSTAILERICSGGQTRQQILLVPEQASHETERRLCETGGDSVCLYAEVLSFTRLANRVFSAAGGLAQPELDAGGRLLLMYTALKSVSAQLTVYARPSRKPAFLSGLLSTVDELKSCRVSPAALAAAAEETDHAEGDKLRDLALICGAYEALTARSALDPRDRLTRLAEKLRESGWAKDKDFYIDGFTDFTPQELLVLRGLLAQVPSVTVAFTCDRLEDTEHGAGLFSPARRTAASLLRLARETGVPARVETLAPACAVYPPALSFLERNLFAHDEVRFPGPPEELELFSAWTPRSEVEWAAARILALVQDGGYRFREIAVAARGFEAYGDLVESVFQRYGIPVFVTAMTDILQKPVLALVSSALEIAAGGYTYDDVFRYLKTGLSGLCTDDCDILENYVLKWDIRGARWTSRKDWAMHPRGYGFPLTEQDNALLERLNALRRSVTAPLEKLRKNPDRTGAGHALALYAFLEEIGLPEQLRERTDLLRGQGELTLSQEYGQLWEILCGALEQCAGLLGETPMELDEFSRLFQLVLSQYDVGAIPVSLDRVTAGEAPRIVNKRIKVLFLLGADDGAIPQVAPSPGLLTDDDRSLLASYGLELAPRLDEKLYREMTILYAACTQPSERLAVSWPRAGGDGEEKRPSFFVERLKLLFPELRTVEEGSLGGSFRLAAPRPALEQAGHRPELRAVLKLLPGYAPLVERLEQAERWERGSLSKPAVALLYGRRVPMSASRMDKYKSCHFSYFMQYGLKARPRQPAGFRAPEYGTFVHYVLEQVFRGRKPGADKAELHRLARAAVDRYIAQELGGLEDQTPRFVYLFNRLLRSLYLIVENVAEELASSDFQPVSFELGFGEKGDLPPVELTVDGITLSISGFVDRVDGWVKDGRLYLRVIDYKTGRKSFDLTEIWNGMGLQMLLYLFTLGRKGKALYGSEVVPAGVLYLPARDSIIAGSRTMSEEDRRRAVDKELRRHGLLLNDPEVLAAMERPSEDGIRFLPVRVSRSTGVISGDNLVSARQMGRLGAHIQKVLDEICRELASGSIDADPFWRGAEKNACLYCDYAAACHFEEGRGGDRRRWLPSVGNQEFWTRLAPEDAESER